MLLKSVLLQLSPILVYPSWYKMARRKGYGYYSRYILRFTYADIKFDFARQGSI